MGARIWNWGIAPSWLRAWLVGFRVITTNDSLHLLLVSFDAEARGTRTLFATRRDAHVQIPKPRALSPQVEDLSIQISMCLCIKI